MRQEDPILGGEDAKGAFDELVAVAQRLESAHVTSRCAERSSSSMKSFEVGMTDSRISSGHAMRKLGCAAHARPDSPIASYPTTAALFRIDTGAKQIGDGHTVSLGVLARSRPRKKTKKDSLSARRASPLGLLEKRNASAIITKHAGDGRLRVGEPGNSGFHPQYVAKIVDEMASEDAIIPCEWARPPSGP